MKDFCTWLITLQHSHATVCAHNSASFDSYFTLKELMLLGTKISDIIVKGGQILYFRVPAPHNIRFVDSIKILLSKLSKLPDMFSMNSNTDVDNEIQKGFFPHLFNTTDKIDNNYVGPMPPKKYYLPDHMSPETKEKFNEWYDDKVQSNYVFNLKEELIKYCINDVIILKLAIIEFDKIIHSLSGVRPFRACFTLASLSMIIFRKDFITEEHEATLKNVLTDEITMCKAYKKHGQFKILLNGQLVEPHELQDIEMSTTFTSTMIGIVPEQGYRRHAKAFSRITE